MNFKKGREKGTEDKGIAQPKIALESIDSKLGIESL